MAKSSSSAASKSSSSAAKSSSTLKPGVSVSGKNMTVPANTSAATVAAAKAAGYNVTVTGSSSNTSSSSSNSGSTPSAGQTYYIYNPTTGASAKTVLTSAQVAAGTRAGLNITAIGSAVPSTTASSPTTTSTPSAVKPTPTKNEVALQALEKKGVIIDKASSTIQINTSSYGQVPTATIKEYEKKGYTVNIVTDADIAKQGGGRLVNMATINDPTPTDSLTVAPGEATDLNKTWDKVGKNGDPAQMSEFLNAQGDRFETRVEGDKVIGTKDGIEQGWKFNGTDWEVDKDFRPAPTDGTEPADTGNAAIDANDADQKAAYDKVHQPVIEETQNFVDGFQELNKNNDEITKGQFSDMWARAKAAEEKGLAALDDIDKLGRKQFEENIANVSRTISGRLAGQSAKLSGQGFDPSVIANMAAQLDSAYVGDRLEAQKALLENLNTTHKNYQDLYAAMNEQASSLSAAERTFMNGISDRMVTLETYQKSIAELKGGANQAELDYYTAIGAALREPALVDAKQKGYQSVWEKSSVTERLAMLRSNLNSFLGSILGADGKTPKYPIETLKDADLQKFAEGGNMQSAYAAAASLATNGEYTDAKPGVLADGTGGSSSSAPAPSSNKSTPAPAPAATPVAAITAAGAPAAEGSTKTMDERIASALAAGKELNRLGGFAKTTMTYEEWSAGVKAAKAPQDIVEFGNLIKNAISATPAYGKEQERRAKIQDALSPYYNLDASKVAVVKGSPHYSKIDAILKELNAIKDNPGSNPGVIFDRIKHLGAELNMLVDQSLKGINYRF